MEDIIRKAAVLVEALPYIQSFRDKYVVIKLGGSMMGDKACVGRILMDIVFMEQVGMRPVVVLGGGPLVSTEMKKRGIEPVFLDGRRVTNEETLKIVDGVISDQILPWAAGMIGEFGGKAEIFHHKSNNVVCAECPSDDDQPGLGFVGEPVRVDIGPIESACAGGAVAVRGPICLNGQGGILNVNADHRAAAVAGALRAEKIVFLSDVKGVLRNEAKEDSLISTLNRKDVGVLVKDGAISAGMMPKVDSCIDAMDRGVRKAHIIDGRMPHSLLLEIFTDEGIGTQITNE